ncbi:histidine kinase [Nonomuraea sp. NPDC050404]|uniref:sensor histidine kinase n=1 Tax=Nonomuraea sp. NPDC050404 TaxID=3155783 RepID=UPI0033F819A9
MPVVVMLAWAGWLAVPWSFSGLAQARAAAAAAAEAQLPPVQTPAMTQEPPSQAGGHAVAPDGWPSGNDASPNERRPGNGAAPLDSAADGWRPGNAASPGDGVVADGAAWGIPAARTVPLTTVRRGPEDATTLAANPSVLAAEPSVLAAEPDAGFVALERARIAGEVHDAAGHGLAAIAMQAGLALVTLDDDPEQARASLRAIKETSTTALAHLRAALDGIDPPAGDLRGLIAGVRAAGLPVDVEPADFTVPAQLRGAVYGVVRESLTNVLRHAGPTRALVRTDAADARRFVVEVADRGIGWTGTGEGRGLSGMRAKVTQAGGHFTAGPRDGGGFRVIATFPRDTA